MRVINLLPARPLAVSNRGDGFFASEVF